VLCEHVHVAVDIWAIRATRAACFCSRELAVLAELACGAGHAGAKPGTVTPSDVITTTKTNRFMVFLPFPLGRGNPLPLDRWRRYRAICGMRGTTVEV
jgi:hypothetical protein